MSKGNDITYHIQIHYDNKSVEVSTLGMNRVDSELQSYYSSVDELPEWAQSKLSVLNMLKVPPPLCDVVGVGARMGPYLYWLYT